MKYYWRMDTGKYYMSDQNLIRYTAFCTHKWIYERNRLYCDIDRLEQNTGYVTDKHLLLTLTLKAKQLVYLANTDLVDPAV